MALVAGSIANGLQPLHRQSHRLQPHPAGRAAGDRVPDQLALGQPGAGGDAAQRPVRADRDRQDRRRRPVQPAQPDDAGSRWAPTRRGSRWSVADLAPPADPALPGELVLVLPNGVRLPIRDSMTIGRGETADVKLDDRTVSRLHARIDSTPEGPMISDAGSRFGVTVAGQKLSEPRRLTAGTEIRLGNVTLRVESALAATAPGGPGGAGCGGEGRRPTPPSSSRQRHPARVARAGADGRRRRAAASPAIGLGAEAAGRQRRRRALGPARPAQRHVPDHRERGRRPAADARRPGDRRRAADPGHRRRRSRRARPAGAPDRRPGGARDARRDRAHAGGRSPSRACSPARSSRARRSSAGSRRTSSAPTATGAGSSSSR